MSKPIRKISRSSRKWRRGKHRFEHWQVDNQVYFITARCRGSYPAFTTESAKEIFWDRLTHYTTAYAFEPWVTSLLDNHYHTLGFLSDGSNLSPMMQRIHGSVAKLVNDTLPQPLRPFWRDRKGHEYFDGCIRDEKQLRLAYGYVVRQSVRHGLCDDWRNYPHTRVLVTLDEALALSRDRDALLKGVPYRRYFPGRS